MTTHVPRPAYSEEELTRLYPKELTLKHVQVILRHGERTPVNARFQSAGLPAYWPYCNAARQLRSVVLASKDGPKFDSLEWRRRIETFSKDDSPTIAAGPQNQLDAICNPGELTDKGRDTTLALGERLRHLYVHQLRFIPTILSDPSMLYIRATPIPRALESVQQAFLGLYPPTAWAPSMPSPTIVTRAPGDETLFPNESGCKRFAQLSHAFAQRCADLWNESPEMQYLNKELGKWMPEGNGKIAVDGHPRLSGIMDSLNATLAHGPETRLPSAFYKDQVRETIDKIVVEEWFAGYQESQEYRMLGIGGLVRDMTIRMIDSVEGTDSTSFCISGAHDTTLAAILSSFGAYEKEKWPPFTSHIAMELFEKREIPQAAGSWWSSFPLFSSNRATNLAQKKFPDMTADEKIKLRDYYVRVRFNDRPVVIPGCKTPRKHLEGNETFCTLAAFKEIADKFAPDNWKGQCRENLGLPGVPAVAERAGF